MHASGIALVAQLDWGSSPHENDQAGKVAPIQSVPDTAGSLPEIPGFFLGNGYIEAYASRLPEGSPDVKKV
jgi:hypothetical protein